MDGSLKVLIVEDNIDHAKLMSKRLQTFNPHYEIHISHSGKECLRELSKHQYEAIILDYHIPGSDGLEILNQIKKDKIDIPVVFVSGQGSEEVAVEALKKGAYDYIVKSNGYLSNLPKVVQKSIEKHHLELRLLESERKYQNIFEKANDAILIVDREALIILDANIKTSEELGYSKDEILRLTFTDLFPENLKNQAEKLLVTTVSQGSDTNDNMSIKSRDGCLIPVDIKTSMIHLGNEEHILCTARNIAEKKQLQTLILNSKNRLQNTFDSIQDVIYQVNQDLEIIVANKRFAEVCHSQPEKLIGKKCYEVYSACKLACQDCPVAFTFENQVPKFVEKRDGDKVYEIWSYPIFNMEGELEAVTVNSKDVTEKRKLEKSLIQSEKLATIGLLASGIAHELRNPLNIIETARYYIDEFLPVSNSDIKNKLEIIQKNVRRSSNIINNLLEFSRHSEKEKEKIDLQQLINNTVSLIKKELEAKHIEYSFVCDEHFFAYLNIDSLKQVLLNIFINAIQAMPDGGKLIVQIAPGEPGFIDVHVTDTGVGIPEKNLPHLFSPFFTTKEVGVGTGLGLYIAHIIVDREGGGIKVRSKVGEGTRFTISLPESAGNDFETGQNTQRIPAPAKSQVPESK